MDARQIVQSISMGSRVAEDERDDLASYFVETENWRKVYEGEVDVVFAPKGGGKSAIYSMLMTREAEFFDRGILLATAENPSGGTAFQEVDTVPPTSEGEFIGLWKIYFLTIIAQALTEYEVNSDPARRLFKQLKEAGLLSPSKEGRRQLVRRAMDYVKSLFRPIASIEAQMSVDRALARRCSSRKLPSWSRPSNSGELGHCSSTNCLTLLSKRSRTPGLSSGSCLID